MKQLDYLFRQHESIVAWYHQAESKATLLHAVNGALVVALNGLVFVGAGWFNDVQSSYGPPIKALLATTSVCLVVSYLFMLRAVWARHHSHGPQLADNEKLWFFGDVAALTRDEYAKLLDPFNERDVVSTMITQNYVLSHNVMLKFDALNRATSLTIAAIIMFFCFGLVYALGALA